MSKRRKGTIDTKSDISRMEIKDQDHSVVDEKIYDDTTSSYEKIRLDNIQRNTAFLANLGLDEVKPDPDIIFSKRKASSRGIRKVFKSVAPTRRSSRVTAERVKTELEDAKVAGNAELIQSKEAELDQLLQKKYESSYEANMDSLMAESSVHERFGSAPISMLPTIEETENNSDTSSASRLEVIPIVEAFRSLQAPSISTDAVLGDSGSDNYIRSINSMDVKENDVAKLTQDRIVSVMFHPSTDKLLVAAGDKSGHLGLWDVDSLVADNDGVSMYRPHVSNIAAIHCWPQDFQKIWSVSYDGTIRFMDVHQQAFVLGFEAPEPITDIYFSDACFASDGHSILLGLSDGRIASVDTRQHAKTYTWQWEVQQTKINSVQFVPKSPNLIVTAGAGQGGLISIHDIRKIKSKQAVLSFKKHTKSINAAQVSPDGLYLVTVSQDNTIKCWENFLDASIEPRMTSISHDNHTGRWLSTFRPVFDPKQAHTFIIGSMEQPRKIEFFSVNKIGIAAATLKRIAAINREQMRSVCSRNAIHPSLNVIAGGNSSGRVHQRQYRVECLNKYMTVFLTAIGGKTKQHSNITYCPTTPSCVKTHS
eukprot:gene431-771_t